MAIKDNFMEKEENKEKKRNKFGLKRYIPAPIRREIRKNSGFGCVICGLGLGDYHHVEPEFEEAKEHNPDRMTFLCGQHHIKASRKFLSKQTVQEAMADPYCKRQGFTSEFLDIGKTPPVIIFAGVGFTKVRIPIEIANEPVIEILEAEQEGAPFRLNANLYNSEGRRSLQIINNEWCAYDQNWDVEASGGVITIRDGSGHISLQLKAEPPNGIRVEKLDMFVSGYRLIGDTENLTMTNPSGRYVKLTRCFMMNGRVGIRF